MANNIARITFEITTCSSCPFGKYTHRIEVMYCIRLKKDLLRKDLVSPWDIPDECPYKIEK